jgi:hypothetical protein
LWITQPMSATEWRAPSNYSTVMPASRTIVS